MKKGVYILVVYLFFGGCESALGPNDLGGNTNLNLTRVGNEFGINLNPSHYEPAFNNIRDSVIITKNEGGIITVYARFTIDEHSLKRLDTSLGISTLPDDKKRLIIDYYKTKFNINIDTTNKDSMSAHFNLKLKVTSDGIQEFISSKGDLSRPYTIMKYNAKVGDKYEFVDPNGNKKTRTVIQTHQNEDWDLGYLLVKTMRVEQETPDDPITSKVIYIGNHKFGLVGMIIHLRNGKTLTMQILPWAVL